MAINKKFKLLTLAFCFVALICAMPLMASAAVDATNPIAITGITIGKDADTTLLDVTVAYEVYDTVGDQITILATADSASVDTDSTTGEVNNVVYIDQVAKPALATDRNFSFKVAVADFNTSGGTLYIKVGGTSITNPGGDNELIPSDIVIPSDKIAINMCNPFGIANSGIVTVDNSVSIVDPTAKKITFGGTTLYYNAARKKYVGIVRTTATLTAADATISDGASENLTYGMINADAEISPLDAADIINIYLGSISGTDKQLLASDVNDDKEVSPLDAADIINKYLGSISTFTIEGK